MRSPVAVVVASLVVVVAGVLPLVACPPSTNASDAGVEGEGEGAAGAEGEGGEGEGQPGDVDAGPVETNGQGCIDFHGASTVCGSESNGAVCQFSVSCGSSTDANQCSINCEMGSTVTCLTIDDAQCLDDAVANNDCAKIATCHFIL